MPDPDTIGAIVMLALAAAILAGGCAQAVREAWAE